VVVKTKPTSAKKSFQISSCMRIGPMGPILFAVIGTRVFNGFEFLEDQTVVVTDGTITAFGPSSGAEVPTEAEIFEGKNRTLLPGFVDAHVHIGFYDPKTVLAGGITAARDLGWPAKEVFPLAERLRASTQEGPMLLASGPMITCPGGYPSRAEWAPPGTALEVRNEEEATEAVRGLTSEGAAIIKVAQDPRAGPVLEPEVLKAVVDEAHRAGLHVTSHLGGLDHLKIALASGVDELAHGLWSDEEIPEEVIERMVAQGMKVIPTLHIDPSPVRIQNLRRFHEAGGKVIYGTDMGNTGPPPGIDPTELKLMHEAGMSIEQVLASATSAASHLGLKNRGVIEAGAPADLVLVDGDPRDDFRVLSNVVRVIRSGT
jgi:imidazolonepropionase-like amidohydrolase